MKKIYLLGFTMLVAIPNLNAQENQDVKISCPDLTLEMFNKEPKDLNYNYSVKTDSGGNAMVSINITSPVTAETTKIGDFLEHTTQGLLKKGGDYSLSSIELKGKSYSHMHHAPECKYLFTFTSPTNNRPGKAEITPRLFTEKGISLKDCEVKSDYFLCKLVGSK